MLSAKRESLPDVPAVYFAAPTDENIRVMCEDLRRAMYDSFYLNTIGPIQRQQLEDLAGASVYGSSTQLVQKVRFTCIESSIIGIFWSHFSSPINILASLHLKMRFLFFESIQKRARCRFSVSSNAADTKEFNFIVAAINDIAVEPEQMDVLLNAIASGLFAVCVTLGVVPIIKSPKGNAAEQVAIVRLAFFRVVSELATCRSSTKCCATICVTRATTFLYKKTCAPANGASIGRCSLSPTEASTSRRCFITRGRTRR